LKILSIISKFHPLDYQWLLLEEVVSEVAEVEEDWVLEEEEEVVKDHPHLLYFFLK
jgi:hypothetical protein